MTPSAGLEKKQTNTTVVDTQEEGELYLIPLDLDEFLPDDAAEEEEILLLVKVEEAQP
jgi:hypothetical protein